MKPYINVAALSQKTLKSAALGPLATIAHPIGGAGHFEGVVYRAGIEIGRFALHANDETDRMQVNLDLSDFSADADRNQECERLNLKSDGYLVLHASRGTPEYVVELYATSHKRKRKKVLSTKRLGSEDIFAATLLRPGVYSLNHSACKQSGSITVSYPKVGNKPYRPADPVQLTVEGGKLCPRNVTLGPAQGLVMRSDASGAFSIELEKPDDGPDKKAAGRRGFRRTAPRPE